MKILLPIKEFGPAGGYRVLSKLATEWHRAGHHVRFLTPARAVQPYHPTEAPFLSAEPTGPVRDGLPGETTDRQPLAWNTRCLMNGLRQVGNDFDVVLASHSLTTWPIYLARIAPKRRFYYIQADEADYYREEGSWVGYLAARGSYALTFTQIVNAPLYLRNPAMRAVAVVPPGLDLSTFSPRRATRDFADGRPIVLGTIGRRERWKGTHYVLSAFEQLARLDARFRLRVAYGNLPEGWAHPALEVVVPSNDLELADFYRSVDILVAAGTVQHGAAHYPVMEAMACGTPVVTTDYLPANAENSWPVPSGDVPALVAAVLTLVGDPAYPRKVAKARQAIGEFAWANVAEAMISVFERHGHDEVKRGLSLDTSAQH